MKHIFNTIVVLQIFIFSTYAQQPKWFKKAAKAQMTIITYDKGGNILRSGQGFFIDEQGTAVADYNLFKEAHAARVVTADGKEFPVSTINGASSLYDVLKFKVESKKKTPFLPLTTRKGTPKEKVYILPYPTHEKRLCMSDTLTEIQTFGEKYEYYTLTKKTADMFVSSPVMNEEGEVMALVQRNAGTATTSYAIDVRYVADMNITGLSAGNSDLSKIHIRKALPTDLSEVNTFLFMIAGRCDSAEYHAYLNNFVETYPDSSMTYTKRAEFYINHNNYELAEIDLDKAIELDGENAANYYTYGKLLYDINLKPDYQTYKDWDLNKSLQLIRKAHTLQAQPFYSLQEAKTLFALKEYEQAHDKFLSLTTTNMRSADLFLYAAECKSMAGADTLTILALQDSAVACYTKPYPAEAATALVRRANTLIQLGRHRNAVADLYEYERLISGHLPATFYYGRFLSEMKCRMYQQALEDIDRAIRLSPREALFHLQRAVLLYSVGETTEAISSAQKSVELAPDFAEAYRILGICQMENKDTEAGKNNLKKAAELGDETAKRLLEE